MKQHIEVYADEKCCYCGQRNGTLLASEYDEEGLPCRWHHPECKKAADLAWLRRQWQRHDIRNGGL